MRDSNLSVLIFCSNDFMRTLYFLWACSSEKQWKRSILVQTEWWGGDSLVSWVLKLPYLDLRHICILIKKKKRMAGICEHGSRSIRHILFTNHVFGTNIDLITYRSYFRLNSIKEANFLNFHFLICSHFTVLWIYP